MVTIKLKDSPITTITIISDSDVYVSPFIWKI